MRVERRTVGIPIGGRCGRACCVSVLGSGVQLTATLFEIRRHWRLKAAASGTQNEASRFIEDPFDSATPPAWLLKHFLDASGTPVSVDLGKLLRDSSAAFAKYKASFDAAVAFVNSLSFTGTVDFTETKARLVTTQGSNWAPAVGEFTGWGGMRVTGTLDASGNVNYIFSCRYNLWDPYDWVPAGRGFKVSTLARMHLEGLGQQFMTTGTYRASLYFKQGIDLPSTSMP